MPRVPEAEALEQHAAALAPFGDAVEAPVEVEVLERGQLAVDERLVSRGSRCARGRRVMSSSPPVGTASPAQSRSSVVLPDPFGPVTTRNPSRATLELDAAQNALVAVPLLQSPRARISRGTLVALAPANTGRVRPRRFRGDCPRTWSSSDMSELAPKGHGVRAETVAMFPQRLRGHRRRCSVIAWLACRAPSLPEYAIFHVTARGAGRMPIYRDDDDRRPSSALLADAVRRFDWSCHAFCLMTNHYHLVVESIRAALSAGMQLLNGIYAQSFNGKYDRWGHVFGDRFWCRPLDEDDLERRLRLRDGQPGPRGTLRAHRRVAVERRPLRPRR